MDGAINNATFRSILFGSSFVSWDPIVVTLYATTLSVKALIQLNAHLTQVSRHERRNINLAISPTIVPATFLSFFLVLLLLALTTFLLLPLLLLLSVLLYPL